MCMGMPVGRPVHPGERRVQERRERAVFGGLRTVSLVVAVLLSTLSSGCRKPPEPPSAVDGLPCPIAAVAGPDKSARLVAISVDGTMRFSETPIGVRNLAWSSSSRQLAFDAYRELPPDRPWLALHVWVAEFTGASFRPARPLPKPTDPLESESSGGGKLTGPTDPSWNPDGSELALVYGARIWRHTLRDERYRPVTPYPDTFGGESVADPAWSPDGRLIAFTTTVTDPFPPDALHMRSYFRLRLVSPDGAEATSLPVGQHDLNQIEADWSPDGSLLAYLAWDETTDPHVVILDAQMEEVRRLETAPAGGFCWSPGAGQLAVVVHEETGSDVSIVDFDSGTSKMLGLNRAELGGVSWSPDGELLAIDHRKDGRWQICVYTIDTGKEQNIALPGEDIRMGVWLD